MPSSRSRTERHECLSAEQSSQASYIVQSAQRGQISYSCGSESRTRKLIYTMGILYGRILTWQTEQVVNSSQRYVSATPVRRLLSQELVETTIL